MTSHSLLVIKVSARAIVITIVVIILVEIWPVVILIEYVCPSIISIGGSIIIAGIGTRNNFRNLRFRCWLLPLLFAYSVAKRVS